MSRTTAARARTRRALRPVAAGTTVFDDEYAGIADLDPALLHALRDAATDAAEDGITFSVNSGWRSREHQDRLLPPAVPGYGSEAEAARRVATADASAHVSGHAVDIEPSGAAAWPSEHGAGYGLCQIYANEPWHYELRRICNQAFFDRINVYEVENTDTVDAEPGEPFDMLFRPALHAEALAYETRRRAGDDTLPAHVEGVDIEHRVGPEGLEPPASSV